MRKAGRIESPGRCRFASPRQSSSGNVRRDFVAVHLFAAEFAVERVQVQAMFAGNQGKGLLQIGAEFLRGAGLAGIIAGGDEPAAQRAAEIFKTAHVVALPASGAKWECAPAFSARGQRPRRWRHNILWRRERLSRSGFAGSGPCWLKGLLVLRKAMRAVRCCAILFGPGGGWRIPGGASQNSTGNSLLRIDIAIFKRSLFCFPHI